MTGRSTCPQRFGDCYRIGTEDSEHQIVHIWISDGTIDGATIDELKRQRNEFLVWREHHLFAKIPKRVGIASESETPSVLSLGGGSAANSASSRTSNTQRLVKVAGVIVMGKVFAGRLTNRCRWPVQRPSDTDLVCPGWEIGYVFALQHIASCLHLARLKLYPVRTNPGATWDARGYLPGLAVVGTESTLLNRWVSC